eukprot:SAG22_NODE_172_length_16609_cov_14.370806_9_plen_124_part_00
MPGAADSDDIHPVDSHHDKNTAPKLSTPDCGSAGIGSLSKPIPRTGDFDKDKNPIYESVLDDIYPNLTGMHTCTAMNSIFSSVFESCHMIFRCLPAVQMSAASTSHPQILTQARHSQVRAEIQ